jgi:DNA-binding transcriptional ArsR family regulator
MPAAIQSLFRALAEPTAGLIFEHLARDGERTVHALTDRARPPALALLVD